jgi:HEAT repeat protein
MAPHDSPSEHGDETRFSSSLPPGAVPQEEAPPPVGITPPVVLARDAAAGRRGAAWRLLHWIMEDDPRAIIAVSHMEDDRLARHLLEFIALGTWAGKSFVVPTPLHTAYARTRLRTLFLPGSGMEYSRVEHVLTSAVHDPRPAVRAEAIHILGIIEHTGAVPLLIEALHDHVPPVRLQAAKALGRIRHASAVPALLAALHNADEQLGSQIFTSLVQIGSPAVPQLLQKCSSSSSWIRWHSVRALIEIHDYRALPVLVQALNGADRSIAWLAAKGLPRYGKACVAPILRLLMTAETSPWLAETTSFVLHNLYVRDRELKPYLEPVVQSMSDLTFRVGTPLAARKAFDALTAAGTISMRG